MVRFAPAWCGDVWLGQARWGEARPGEVWRDVVRFGWVRSGRVRWAWAGRGRARSGEANYMGSFYPTNIRGMASSGAVGPGAAGYCGVWHHQAW
jgi:hypothetical protein